MAQLHGKIFFKYEIKELDAHILTWIDLYKNINRASKWLSFRMRRSLFFFHNKRHNKTVANWKVHGDRYIEMNVVHIIPKQENTTIM